MEFLHRIHSAIKHIQQLHLSCRMEDHCLFKGRMHSRIKAIFKTCPNLDEVLCRFNGWIRFEMWVGKNPNIVGWFETRVTHNCHVQPLRCQGQQDYHTVDLFEFRVGETIKVQICSCKFAPPFIFKFHACAMHAQVMCTCTIWIGGFRHNMST
jgi:hypothetical protein